MIRKIKQQKGETLVESMVAMLIAVLSVTLLSSTVVAATRINQANRTKDNQFREELQRAENMQEAPIPSTLKVKFGAETAEIDVNVYGGDGTFISYDQNP